MRKLLSKEPATYFPLPEYSINDLKPEKREIKQPAAVNYFTENQEGVKSVEKAEWKINQMLKETQEATKKSVEKQKSIKKAIEDQKSIRKSLETQKSFAKSIETQQSLEESLQKLREAEKSFEESLAAEKFNETKAIWFRIQANDSFWVSACHRNGFELQLAVGESVKIEPSGVIYMKKWMADLPSPLSLPAFTTIGMSAIVVNEHGEYLVLREVYEDDIGRTHKLAGSHRLPAKALLPTETFETAVKRLLKEEVNMDEEHINFHGVLEFKHMPDKNYPMRARGDLFIYCFVTTEKDKHTELKDKHEWLTSDEVTSKILRAPVDYSAFLAAKVWAKRYGLNFEENKHLKMFKAGNYTPSAVTYVFYKTTLLDIMPDIIPESKKDKDPGVIKYVSKHQTSITTQEQAEWVLENALKKLEQQQVPSEHAIIVGEEKRQPSKQVKAIYFEIAVEDSFWIDACHKSGFELHWAVDKSLGVDPAGVIYMKKWLDTKHPDSLPLAAFTTVGVGAVVMNELNEYLLIEEDPVNDVIRNRELTGGYKLPGMAMLPGESIDTAVKRILEKEAGLKQKHLNFHGILEMKHYYEGKQNKRGRGDIFFYCILTTKKEDHDQIPEKREWIESTNDKLKNMLKHETDYNAVLAANAWKAKFVENVSKNNGDPKLFRHGKGKNVAYLFYREAADWVEQPSSKTIAPAGDETTDVGEENKAQ